jgi:hypothetical protein
MNWIVFPVKYQPMNKETAKNNRILPIYLKLGLLLVLLISGMDIFYSVNWIYHRIHDRFGPEIAEVVVAFLTVLIVLLILFGFGVGFGTDRILRRQKIQALWIYRSLKRSMVIRSLWGYIVPNRQMENPGLPAVETISLPQRAPRRGRRPTYSLDRWMRVVQAWENRNTDYNTMTLSEFLAEEFGIYADGSPRMSENSYYDWRKKVFRELRKQESREKEKSTA